MKRWQIMDKILYISLALLVLFAWADSQNLIGIKMIDAGWQNSEPLWGIFWDIIQPAIVVLWYGVLLAIALIWYVYSKDKSEALALFITPAILIYFGVQDIIYYIISPDVMTECMGCWADVMFPIRIISDLLGETCPSATAMIISAGIGCVLSYKTYNYLKKRM